MINIAALKIQKSYEETAHCMDELPMQLIGDFGEVDKKNIAKSSMLGRWLLYNQLLKYNVHIEDSFLVKRDINNKPYFSDNHQWKFNISHSGELVVCALAYNINVGIDIEIKADIEMDDFKSHFTLKEWKMLNEGDKKDLFYDIWTRKEALTKAEGVGIVINLADLETSNDFVQFPQTENKWYLHRMEIHEDYAMNIACSEMLDCCKISWY